MEGYKMCKLKIKGGVRAKYISGSCACGKFSEYLNMPHRGNSKNYRQIITAKFKAHKAGA
jgi:hypothetical protein